MILHNNFILLSFWFTSILTSEEEEETKNITKILDLVSASAANEPLPNSDGNQLNSFIETDVSPYDIETYNQLKLLQRVNDELSSTKIDRKERFEKYKNINLQKIHEINVDVTKF